MEQDKMDKKQLLSSLPSVDEILKSQKGIEWQQTYPRRFVLQAIREVLQGYREAILKGNAGQISPDALVSKIEKEVTTLSEFSLRPVINATGVVLHTNLGRSVMSEEVMENVKKVACGYSNLEYDLEKGKRGKRYAHVQRLLREITGAEDGLVVNNNAAAVFVCLNTMARTREVIVSRGELVEIGGSFRIPEVMSSSGAILREVGTTNKTHGFDYERAINDQTALLLKVHQSNYRMVGFTESLSVEELVSLGRTHGLPVMFDLGSGSLIDLRPYGVHSEPTVQEVLKAGVNLVTFSGDKLLGGPQAGIIVGKAEFIEKISKNPLLRAVRIDKLTLAALEGTLRCYADEDRAKSSIPTLRLLVQDVRGIRRRAKRAALLLRKGIASPESAKVAVLEDSSQAGGGSLPEIAFDTYVVAIRPLSLSVNELEMRLRHGKPPIIARIRDDSLIIDLRTVRDSEIAVLVKGLCEAMGY